MAGRRKTVSVAAKLSDTNRISSHRLAKVQFVMQHLSSYTTCSDNIQATTFEVRLWINLPSNQSGSLSTVHGNDGSLFVASLASSIGLWVMMYTADEEGP